MSRLDYTQLSPTPAHALFALEKAVNGLGLEPKLKQLVKIRVSQLNGCLFCTDMHVKEAKVQGERELRLYHLTAWEESPLFDEREKAGLRWAELLTRLDGKGIHDDDYQAAVAVFGEKGLSDLTFAVTTINAWNRLGVAFRTKLGLYDEQLGLDKAGLR